MRQFLVVGCGGSGAETLAYMMDQLRSELAEVGIDRLPRAWQFVSIDVPTSPDSVAKGMIRDVQSQGGRYVACAPQTDTYEILDSGVVTKLRARDGLGEIATWSRRDPANESTSIQNGAGQYRGLGRMITLNAVGKIQEALDRAWTDMCRSESEDELAEVADKVPGSGGFKRGSDPVVLVVASMAGGSGASMALDVCRIITQVDGAKPDQIGLFAVAPNIFDELDKTSRLGVRANGLGMFGEIIAAQSGASQKHDIALLKAAGLDTGVGAVIPFARMFPVGRFVGTGKLFGDGSKAEVYRALARGLGAMMLSDRATQQFVAYDLGNKQSPSARVTELGWGFPSENDFPWGSYGFASLSMGRDRYSEYAAQRLSRAAVDQLLEGHLNPASSASGPEQLKTRLDSQWNVSANALGMPTDSNCNGAVDWLSRVALGEQMVGDTVSTIIERDIAPQLPREDARQRAGEWLALLNAATSSEGLRSSVEESARASAYRWAYNWQRQLESSLLTIVDDDLGRFGIPYAVELINRYRNLVEQAVLPEMSSLAGNQTGNAADLPATARQMLSGLGKSKLSGTGEEFRAILQQYHPQIRMLFLTHAARFCVEVLSDFVGGVLTPLGNKLAEMQTLLERERGVDSKSIDVGMARIATDHYVAWPDENAAVPKRFEVAGNEVLMTSVSEYPELFKAHLPEAADPNVTGMSYTDALPKAVSQVTRGQWPTTGGIRPPGGLIEVTSTWRASRLNSDPETGAPVVPSSGAYDVHVRPAEIVKRARMFVHRPQISFRKYADVSLNSFVEGEGASEYEIADRRKMLVSMFQKTLDAALPLSSVNNSVVNRLYGTGLTYRYKFSEIPFDRNQLVQEQLREVLTTNSTIDGVATDNFDAAQTDSHSVKRIDVFGSYPNYSPLAYTMVLGEANEDWNQTQEQGKAQFWTLRRARPLPGSLPMSEAERKAMVAGWFIGQITGRIVTPEPPYSDPVYILDPSDGKWINFPNPLLTPPGRFLNRSDWLPAVLESSLLALAQSQSTHLESMKPYVLLRSLYDSNPLGPSGTGGGMVTLAATEILGDWMFGRQPWLDGVTGVGEQSSAEERANAALAWLGQVNGYVNSEYVKAEQFVPGRSQQQQGRFANVQDRPTASVTPMVRDLGPDIVWATEEIAGLLRSAFSGAQPTGGMF